MKPFTIARRFGLPAVALLLTVLVATPLAAQSQAPEDYPTRLITINNVAPNSANTLATNVCQTAISAWERSDRDTPVPCMGVDIVDNDTIAVSATEAVLTRIEALLAELDRAPETRAFQIVVLEATLEGPIDPNVPDNVATALDDVSDFLPYSGYGVIGTGWLRTSESGSTTLTGEGGYHAELRFRPTTDPTAPMLIERFNLFRRELTEIMVDGAPTTNQRHIDVLATTFTIEIGETVVVGTSKLNGDDSALVVLLTAIDN